MAEEKKKSIFDKAVDALTNRDEKAEAEKAEADRRAAVAKAQADLKAASERKAADEKETAEKSAKNMEEYRAREERLEASRKAAAERVAAQEAAKPKHKAQHTVAQDETLSHIALKYYGNAGRDYYMAIYEANKAVIGSNPNMIKVGTVLNIPELPEELKKK